MEIEKGCGVWLDKTADMIKEKASENTAVNTGKTRSGWGKNINYSQKSATIGNVHKNAVWEEFGTGRYAQNGNGRKEGWKYKGDDGNFYFTNGKLPKHAFQRAFEQNQNKAVFLAQKIFKEGLK